MRISGSSIRVVGLLAGLSLLGSGCGDVGSGDISGEEAVETSRGLTFEQFEAQTAREPGTGNYVVNGDQVISNRTELEGFFQTYVQSDHPNRVLCDAHVVCPWSHSPRSLVDAAPPGGRAVRGSQQRTRQWPSAWIGGAGAGALGCGRST